MSSKAATVVGVTNHNKFMMLVSPAVWLTGVRPRPYGIRRTMYES